MTPPLAKGPPGPCPCRQCALTDLTSYGYDVIDFARDVLGMPLDPWQELAAIHGGELLPDGRPRFRTLLILVARQNGKTLLAKVLILYWMFVEELPLTLLTSTDRSYAKRTYQQIVRQARNDAWLSKRLGRNAERKTIGEEFFGTLLGADKNGEGGSELTFRANNGSAGRSMTLWRWLCDELREHRNRDAWDSASNAQNAVRYAQTVCISNAGDATSIVLNPMRDAAIVFIDTGVGDPRTGLLEWSSPEGTDPDDLAGLALANPNMGRGDHGPDPDALLSAALRARAAGGLELSGFITEVMCRRVDLLDPAIEPELWRNAAAAAGQRIDLAEHRDRVALCLDVSMGADHASLIAAALIDGTVYIDVVKAWSGPRTTALVRAELPDIVEQVGPRLFGWFPMGPAAVIAADLAEQHAANWPPRRPSGLRVKLEPITTDTPAAAMSFAALVKTGGVRHYDDPMLTAHVRGTQRQPMGDRWTFGRRGAGPIDGTYSAAGATWLARTMPPPLAPLERA